MRFWINFLIPVIIAVIIISFISTQGYLASQRFGFSYLLLFPLNIITYIGTSFWETKWIGRKFGIRAAGLVGFYEASVAWELQAALGPEPFYPWPPIQILAIILFVFITTLFGRIGAWLTTKIGSKSKVS